MDDRAVAFARRIASFGVPGVPEPQPVVLPDQDWGRLFALVQDERITGLAIESVAAGWLDLTDDQTEQLYAAHRDAMAWSLLIERKLVVLAEAFDREGIAFAVLKGTSVARTVYAEPCLRSFGDLDLLVRSADYNSACALLERLGHRRQRPEPRPGFEIRFGKGSVHVLPEDRIEVDLHRTLVLGPFGLWIDPGELLDRSATFELAARKIPRLDDTGMLLNVAMHASLGRSEARLVPLRDVVEVVERGSIEWETLSRWAASWHLHAVFQHAFRTVSEVLGASLGAEALPFLDASADPGELRALTSYTGGRRGDGATATGTMRAIPGLRRKAEYALALAFPRREFLAARTQPGRAPSYLRRLSIPVRWARSRVKRSTRHIRSGSAADSGR
jgi:hypothetical protein